jgi:hypothetical protein
VMDRNSRGIKSRFGVDGDERSAGPGGTTGGANSSVQPY